LSIKGPKAYCSLEVQTPSPLKGSKVELLLNIEQNALKVLPNTTNLNLFLYHLGADLKNCWRYNKETSPLSTKSIVYFKQNDFDLIVCRINPAPIGV